MKIIQKYLFKELFLPCIFCFLTLNFIFMAGYLVRAADLIIGRGVPLIETLYILSLALPSMVSYIAPMSLLTGVLIVFGGLSQHNELRAMKASGIHPMRFMMPALIVGLLLSLAMFVFNDQVTPRAKYELRKSTKRLAMRHPMALIQPGQFVQLTDNVIFFTRAVEDGEMQEVVAHEGVDSENPVRTIIAERGKVFMDHESGKLEIHLFDGSVSESQEDGVNSVQFKTYKFPAIGNEDLRRLGKKQKDLSLSEILVEMEEKQDDPKNYKKLQIHFHKRISFSLGSFIFVFLGIPIAVIVRRGEVVISFGIAMVAAFLYYVLFAIAHAIAAESLLPPYIALWLPNILLLAVGFFLMRKAILS